MINVSDETLMAVGAAVLQACEEKLKGMPICASCKMPVPSELARDHWRSCEQHPAGKEIRVALMNNAALADIQVALEADIERLNAEAIQIAGHANTWRNKFRECEVGRDELRWALSSLKDYLHDRAQLAHADWPADEEGIPPIVGYEVAEKIAASALGASNG